MADRRPPTGRRRRRRPATPRPPLAVPTWEKPARLIIGRIVATHGLTGTVRLQVFSSFPEHIPDLKYAYIGDETEPRRLIRAQLHPPQALLSFEGITTPEQAQEHVGQLVRIDHDQAAPLAPGEYYHWQILGATVFDEDGARLGVVAEIIETGANDVYVVRTPTGGEILLPAIAEVIRDVDTERGIITVHLLPGLVEPAGPGEPPSA